MLIILLVISISLIILGVIGSCKWRHDDIASTLSIVGVFVLAIVGLFAVIATTNTVKIPQMEERISIYQEENSRIEEQIKTTIQVYQDYEKEVFENIDLEKISSEKLILLTSIYPELKSDAMVQELIKVYIDNTNTLKALRTEKLDYELWRWWLCFM